MYEIVVIGGSRGSWQALEQLLPALPADFPLPVIIVVHRHRDSDDELLSRLLQKICPLPVRDVEDKAPVLPGHVYVAPANYHTLVEDGAFTLSTEGPVRFARPSIDVLFASVADAYGTRTIGVLLTGANDDGAQGTARIKERGGLVVAQDPASSESPVMPAAAIAAGAVDCVLPVPAIAPYLASLCRADTPSHRPPPLRGSGPSKEEK